MTRLIVLTGAPVPGTLRWTEEALSLQHNNQPQGTVDNTRSATSLHSFSALWRQVPTKGDHVGTHQHDADIMPPICPAEATFIATAELTSHSQSHFRSILTNTSLSTASMQTTAEVLDDFYDQSLALHEDLTTSQLSEFQIEITSPCPKWSKEKTQTEVPNVCEHEQVPPTFPIAFQHLNDVEDIPAAAYLRSIEPQTMTVNLIVGIMALPPPRPVTAGRRWGKEREMQLVEMLVGDDTRAGFQITLWLPDNTRIVEDLPHRGTLESQVQILRPRDIVLLRNVALCAYQGRVHGQSLRRGVTKVDLLYRRKLDDSDAGGMFPSRALLEPSGTELVTKKIKRVEQWLMDFVGDDMPGNFREASATTRAALPPDTQ